MSSVEALGHEISYFSVAKGGMVGYLVSIFQLRNVLKESHYEVVHAHYSLCGVIASLAGAKNLVVSLMGSDTKKSVFNKLIIGFFARKKWNKIVVKSDHMLNSIGSSNLNKSEILVLPNGVDFNLFRPLVKKDSRKELGWNLDSKIVLFGADPNRYEKRFDIAERAVKILQEKNLNIELHYLRDVEPEKVPFYINGSDVIVLTSDREGSPNIIKEAMACNVPIVTTYVGDVEKVIRNTAGCIIVSENRSELISSALSKILTTNVQSTDGRENIQWLSNELIAEKLVGFYEK